MTGALVFWLTGLSGSGKTTIADGVRTALEAEDIRVETLDGDDVRDRLHTNLGFSPSDIDKNNCLIADLCVRRRADCDVILVPVISPFTRSRQSVREIISDGFFEIFISADLSVVQERDPKGLYAKAARGEIDNFIGISPDVPYEPPSNPELSIDTSQNSVDASVSRLFDFIQARLGEHTDLEAERA